MFETAVVSCGPARNRVWTTCLGMTGEALLLGVAVVAPLLSPQALPYMRGWIGVVYPVAPPSPQPPEVAVAPRSVVRAHFESVGTTVYLPRSFPAKPVVIEDPPDALLTAALVSGMDLRAAANPIGQVLRTIMDSAPSAVPAPAPRLAPSASAATPRFRLGGVVKTAVLIHRVEPVYPIIARQSRVSGVVSLEGVIGTDGRIRELTVKSGNPLLAPAAVEAVRQWVYQPTLLNGDPVEVIAPIIVTFKLQ